MSLSTESAPMKNTFQNDEQMSLSTKISIDGKQSSRQ